MSTGRDYLRMRWDVLRSSEEKRIMSNDWKGSDYRDLRVEEGLPACLRTTSSWSSDVQTSRFQVKTRLHGTSQYGHPGPGETVEACTVPCAVAWEALH